MPKTRIAKKKAARKAKEKAEEGVAYAWLVLGILFIVLADMNLSASASDFEYEP